tara:strand:- start:1020 stop:2549 length:1530 start_codon:yes stop_codon:yes gene_type:complete
MADTSYPGNTPLALATSSGLTEGYSASQGSSLGTGDLRRRYDFSERFTELAIDQTPFFRLVSKVGKKPTDDPSFKFTEKRQSYLKRYAYVVGCINSGTTDVFNDATVTAHGGDATIATADVLKLYMATDYQSAGNIQNVSGQSTGAIAVGSAGTAPEFFQVNQLVQIPITSTAGGGPTATDYIVIRVTAVGAQATKNSMETKLITGSVVRAASGEFTSYASNAPVSQVYDKDIAQTLEEMRCHVVGTSYGEGSSLLGTTWKDNPYSTGYGQTQIFRTEFGMTNTARATVLKYEPNEWARVWRDKLIEHKWDIEQAGLFGSQFTDAAGITHTQGAVDYILNYGNIFSWSKTKTVDGFLDDMSKYVDPRYNNSKATVYFCSTDVYNWFHKIGNGESYLSANLGLEDQLRYDVSRAGRKKVFGLDTMTVSTVYGDMNIARCISLDRSHVKILGVNMNHVKCRPLVGNGVNRDTSIYVGVQSLENTGTDKRVDMILTELGFEWQMPEAHAVWK